MSDGAPEELRETGKDNFGRYCTENLCNGNFDNVVKGPGNSGGGDDEPGALEGSVDGLAEKLHSANVSLS
uniref:Uncharacterized protein n=1 Tax=Caenorhabditis japonica TaxID=281687 RepID=A0A8R1DN12_CAEJA